MQNFIEKEIQLKNKKTVTIRQANTDDAEKLLNCIKTYLPQSDFIPKLKEEVKMTTEQEAAWIDSFLASDNSLLLVAIFEDDIIGNIDLTGNQRKIMQHTAVIGMGMLEAWRNSGLGTALMKCAIDWAKANAILELLWLQVYTENQVALGLYRKLGFQENGTIKNFFKHNDTYFDKLTMSMDVR